MAYAPPPHPLYYQQVFFLSALCTTFFKCKTIKAERERKNEKDRQRKGDRERERKRTSYNIFKPTDIKLKNVSKTGGKKK